jgi:hypothetical protein
VTVRRWKKLDPAALARKERRFAGRTPGEAITLEQWRELGYGNDGPATRPLTQDPVGTYPHPKPKGES